jgi:hypothetical protein
MEAKQCPDGSFVSRSGPHCEFSACPKAQTVQGQPSGELRLVPAPPPNTTSIVPAPTVPAAPASTPPQAAQCNLAPKVCDDGSIVIPDAQCRYGPCIVNITGVKYPPIEDTSGLENGPDEPLEGDVAATVQSVKFIVEHRSTLNGRNVTVHGIVVSGAKPGDTICNYEQPCVPHLMIADSNGDDRDMHYDVPVFLKASNPTSFINAQPVDIFGVITGSKNSVTLTQQ